MRMCILPMLSRYCKTSTPFLSPFAMLIRTCMLLLRRLCNPLVNNKTTKKTAASPNKKQSQQPPISNTSTPPLQPLVSALDALEHLAHLLKRNIASHNSKRAHLALDNGHAQTQLDQPFPFASRHVFAPDLACSTAAAESARGRLDAGSRRQCDVFVVRHIEVTRVRVVDDVESCCGNEEGERQRRQ